MDSLILQTGSRIVKPLMLLFSIFLLLRGHDEPGGGFVGGLMAAAAFCLHAIAYTAKDARQSLHMNPRTLIAWGLLFALGAGLMSLAVGLPFLTGLWAEVYIPLVGSVKLGSPLLFDVGVYLVVFGITTLMVLTIMEE